MIRVLEETDLLLLISLSPLLDDDDQVLLTLLLELSHFAPGNGQLFGHLLHLLPGLVNLEKSIPQLGGLLFQLCPLLIQEAEGIKNTEIIMCL